MQPVSPSKQLVSFPLASIVSDLLHGFDCVPISEATAECLLMVTGNKHTCHVQMPDDFSAVNIYGEPILQPMLWSMTHWLASSERWMRQKIRSDKEREERFIYAHNVKMIQRRVSIEFELPPDMCNVIARKMLDKGQLKKIAALGVKKLAERIEEVQ